MTPVPPSSLWTLIELAGNHLWQSTVVLAAAGLLTLAFRGNRAQVRCWIWLAASLKFLLPFAALAALGAQVGWRPSSSIVDPDVTLTIDAVSQPFSRPDLHAAAAAVPTSFTLASTFPEILVAAWFCGCAAILLTWWVQWRRIAATVRAARPFDDGSELEILLRLKKIGGIRQPVALVSSDTLLEPGVFGILKPVLLWPRRIAEHLNERQMEALLAHELSHVLRRDNLTASLHMLVQAVFWFHPGVWWLGARLLDERERACDEEVIRWGMDPHVYAESILRTCKFCLESPLPCVAGVTGSPLKHRIERIMNNRPTRQLNIWRRLILITAAFVALAGPIAVGAARAPRLGAESQATNIGDLTFAETSVKPTPDTRFYRHTMSPDGRFTWSSVNLRGLIRTAYRGQDFVQMAGMPTWADSDRFAVAAKADFSPTEEQMSAMLRSLLADRFRLRTHFEMREVPVYALVMAGGALGAGVRPTACAAKETVTLPPGPFDPKRPLIPLPCGGIRSGKESLQARFTTMTELAPALGMLVGRPVVDQTGRTEKFDLEVGWTPAAEHTPPAAPGIGPATFAAIEEQLGLRLDPQLGPVSVLVVDHVERPAPDGPQ